MFLTFYWNTNIYYYRESKYINNQRNKNQKKQKSKQKKSEKQRSVREGLK